MFMKFLPRKVTVGNGFVFLEMDIKLKLLLTVL